MIRFGLSALPCGDVAAGVVAQDGRPIETLRGGSLAEVVPELVGHAKGPDGIPVFLGHEIALRVCTCTESTQLPSSRHRGMLTYVRRAALIRTWEAGMMATMERYRYLGVTDDCTDCEQCGKPNLKSTVVLQPLDVDGNSDGDPVYFGSTCAARALSVKGGGRAVLLRARGGHHDTLTEAADARRMLALYGLPETGELTDDQFRQGVETYRRYNKAVADEEFSRVLGRVRGFIIRKRAALAAAAMVDPVCSFCHAAH